MRGVDRLVRVILTIFRDNCRGSVGTTLLRRLCLRLRGLFFCRLGLRVIRYQLRGGHREGRIIFQPRLQGPVVDRIRIQLLVDPLRQPHLLDALDVAGTRSVGQPIQSVHDGLIGGEFGDRQALQRGIGLGLLRFVRGRRRSGSPQRGQIDAQRENTGESHKSGKAGPGGELNCGAGRIGALRGGAIFLDQLVADIGVEFLVERLKLLPGAFEFGGEFGA